MHAYSLLFFSLTSPLTSSLPFSPPPLFPTPCTAVPQVSQLLQYAPLKRLNATQAMTHSFFDELRDPNTKLPNGEGKGQGASLVRNTTGDQYIIDLWVSPVVSRGLENHACCCL
jgi:hypothetical protein